VVGEHEDPITTEEPAMNTLTSNPTAAQQVARYTIDQRVRDAEHRRVVRAARTRRPAVQDPKPSNTHVSLPWWTFRFLRPAH
jgi:hypothetical protein